jgi:hypothetical protein
VLDVVKDALCAPLRGGRKRPSQTTSVRDGIPAAGQDGGIGAVQSNKGMVHEPGYSGAHVPIQQKFFGYFFSKK